MSSFAYLGTVSALILSLAMNNPARHIGQESQNTSMPTGPLSPIGLKIHLNIDGIQFRRSVKNFKEYLRMWSADTRVEFHTKSIYLKHNKPMVERRNDFLFFIAGSS